MRADIDAKVARFGSQLRQFGTELQNDIASLKRAAATKPCADGMVNIMVVVVTLQGVVHDRRGRL